MDQVLQKTNFARLHPVAPPKSRNAHPCFFGSFYIPGVWGLAPNARAIPITQDNLHMGVCHAET